MSTSNEWGFEMIKNPEWPSPEKLAIKRLKAASEMAIKTTGKPLVVQISGGKDSSAIVELAIRSGIPFEVGHSHTTADAPETVRFVRSEFARLEQMGIKCNLYYPYYKGKRTSMWDLIPQKRMPPTRVVRYCCDVLKEHGADGRMIATGVRWDESAKQTEGYLSGRYQIQIKPLRQKMTLMIYLRCMHHASSKQNGSLIQSLTGQAPTCGIFWTTLKCR